MNAKEITASLRAMSAAELDALHQLCSPRAFLIEQAALALASIKRRGLTQVEDAPQALADALGTNAYRIAEELGAVLFAEQEGLLGFDLTTACLELQQELSLRDRLLARVAQKGGL